MPETLTKDSIIQIEIDDLTAMDIESIAFYASHDLVLGSGFGNAISLRGGVKIQEELKELGTLETGKAVVTGAGLLKAKYIIHAVGPRFRENDIEEKLRHTMQNALNAAKEKNIRQIAFPPMGTGFYGIPLNTSAKIMFEEINNHVSGETSLEKVIICTIDKREYEAFQTTVEALNK